MKKIVLWTTVLLVTHALFFVGGAMRGKYTAKISFEQTFESANAHVVLAHYSSYRDIALGIKSPQDIKAKCVAELMATAMSDGVKSCLANDECKRGISNAAREFAPEMLGERSLPIMRRTSCP